MDMTLNNFRGHYTITTNFEKVTALKTFFLLIQKAFKSLIVFHWLEFISQNHFVLKTSYKLKKFRAKHKTLQNLQFIISKFRIFLLLN